MIARFRLLLPYIISLDPGEGLDPEEFEQAGFRFRVYPPYQAAVSVLALRDSSTPVSDIVRSLHAADPPSTDLGITINGRPTIPANAIQIDVLKDDFDRTPTASASTAQSGDPPTDLLFEVANSILYRLRSVARAPGIHPIEAEGSCWRLEYLDDTGQLLTAERGKIRARNGGGFSVSVTGLTSSIWRACVGLERNFRPNVWEILLLDAEAQLPDVVPAVVLAAAALEVLIGASLEALAPTDRLATELWAFINNRGDYRKEPSVAEQYDQLLHALSGHSLKDRPDLWEVFRNLRDARNSLMHEGTLSIGGQPVTRSQAFTLIGRAKELAEWLEILLPPQARRPPLITDSQLQITRMLITNPLAPTP